MRLRVRGFNILELVLAMFIITVGFFAVAKINPAVYKTATVTKEHLIAQRIARNVIDQVRCLPYGTSPTTFAVPQSGLEQVEGQSLGEEFTVNATVSPLSLNSPSMNPAGPPTPVSFGNVTVVVEWRQGVGTTDSNGNNTFTLTGGLYREP